MKHRVTKQNILLLTLALVMLLSSCASGGDTIISSSNYAPQSDTYSAPVRPDITHEDVTISDMTYQRPDIDGMRAAMKDLRDGIKHGKDATELISAYEQIQQMYNNADSMLALIYLRYAFDVTDTSIREEYAYLQSALYELDAEMETVSIALFESSGEVRELAEQAFGEGFVDAVVNDDMFDDQTIQSLLDQQEQLTLDYDNLRATFTMLDNGTRWTYESIQSDTSLSREEYERLYDAYCAQLNEKAGAIFLQQMPIRIEIAKRLGFADYTTYCYENYGRDYSPDDARTLHSAVKEHIVPVFVKAMLNRDTAALSAAVFEEDAFFSALSSASVAFSPLLSESVTYLLKNRLYDLRVSSVKMDASFTTYISNHRAPFIFSSWGGGAENIATMLHELGHFTNYYHNAEVGYSAGDNLDLAEVDAQALVLLLFDDYELFYKDLAEQARSKELLDAMYALVTGCMEDEFQQEIYGHPGMTLDEINALYARLAVEYGLADVYGYQGTEWVLITHTFKYPLYYISYAASIVPALELLEIASSDPTAARNAYFNILLRESYVSLGEVLEKNGLAPVFSQDTIANIANMLKEYTV